ncbi:transforming growth factor beta receptor type 3-like [Tubulanus polymorphus]|uniref:transforming growth factor beta receptor type 3-like n=1 Tax=Tubulanus polymorphus TaxID=672921 RepID=UPI003DA369DC
MLLAILMFTGIGVIAAGNSCTIKDNFKSPYVIPQYEQTSAPHGCASRTLGHGSKEVRAVNYISQGSNSAPVEIKLHLEPLKLITGLFINKLVIILSSTHPITWRVSTRQISNQTKQLFVLSPGSRLLKDSRIRTKVLKSDEMPNNSLLLFDWIKNKYGAVTSLAEVSQINRIVQSVGIDDRLPNECDFEKSSKSTAIQVSKIQLQPMKGCAFPPDRSREVHIIEVHRASTYPLADSAFTTTVDVRIRSKNVAVAVRKSLVIVLKGYSGLNWKLSSQNIYSSINVIGTGDIDTSGIAAGASVKSSVETVGEFGDKLVTFVKQRFGAVTSYTDVTLANMIELVIDPAGKKLTRSPFSHPQQTLSAIRDVMALSCYRSGLKVSLPKKSARMKN